MAKEMNSQEPECLKQARDLAKDLYRISKNGNLNRDYVLRDQLRNSVVSVFSNIEEGRRQETSDECIRFLSFAKTAAEKLRAQLTLSRNIGHICEGDYLGLEDKAIRIVSLIDGLVEKRKRNPSRKHLFSRYR